jgi:hypothetical protein
MFNGKSCHVEAVMPEALTVGIMTRLSLSRRSSGTLWTDVPGQSQLLVDI